MPSRFANQKLLLYKALRERGMTIDDINVVEMPPPDMPAALSVHFFNQAFAFAAIQEGLFGVAKVLDDQADFAAQNVPLQFADFIEIKLVDELGMDLPLQEVEFLRFRSFGGTNGGLRSFDHGNVFTQSGKGLTGGWLAARTSRAAVHSP